MKKNIFLNVMEIKKFDIYQAKRKILNISPKAEIVYGLFFVQYSQAKKLMAKVWKIIYPFIKWLYWKE